jgi:hypothetical protein
MLGSDLWYAAPLIVAFSLVYAATRNEDRQLILRHALRVGLWITGFMGGLYVLMLAISYFVQ